MRLILVLSMLFAAAVPSLAACRRQVVKQQVVQQIVTPVAVAAIAVQVPTYSVGYAPAADQGILDELRRLREAVERLSEQRGAGPQQPITVAGVLQASCVKCHVATAADKDGGGFVLVEKDGKVVPLSVAEKKRLIRRVTKGDMPPKTERVLGEAEKKTLIDWLSQQS